MENVITRIVEVERECAQELDKAQSEYRKRVEAGKALIEETLSSRFSSITAEADEEFSKALKDAQRQADEELTAEKRPIGDPDLDREVKEKIISILLGLDVP